MDEEIMAPLSLSVELRAITSELQWRLREEWKRHDLERREAARQQRLRQAISEATRLAGLGQ